MTSVYISAPDKRLREACECVRARWQNDDAYVRVYPSEGKVVLEVHFTSFLRKHRDVLGFPVVVEVVEMGAVG